MVTMTEERPAQEKLLTPEDIAERLNISLHKAWRFLRTGVIPAIKIGKEYRVEASALEEYIEQNRTNR